MTRPTLLLADDSVTIRKVVELTFADEGIDVTTAADSQSAMQRFVEVQPDIVLVDAGLSGTNGYQICEMIKADEATKHIPVMLLVGSFEPFDADEANRVGADGFMTKPFNSIRELVKRVDILLGRHPEPEVGTEVPVSEEISEEAPVIEAVAPEVEDIEDLYRSSFAETADIEEFDTVDQFETVDDLLGDAGMDDEMIEASYRSPDPVDEPLQIDDDPAENVKEFDWSPEAIVSEELAEDGSPGDERGLDPADSAESSAQSDDSARSDRTNVEGSQESDPSTFETIEFSNAPAMVSMPLSSAEAVEADDQADDGDELLSIFEESNQPNKVDHAIHETVPYSDGEQPVGVIDIDKERGEQISQELIENIIHRVVEKLSDSVVREIARVEVPRIAEKLIREALEQENKI